MHKNNLKKLIAMTAAILCVAGMAGSVVTAENTDNESAVYFDAAPDSDRAQEHNINIRFSFGPYDRYTAMELFRELEIDIIDQSGNVREVIRDVTYSNNMISVSNDETGVWQAVVTQTPVGMEMPDDPCVREFEVGTDGSDVNIQIDVYDIFFDGMIESSMEISCAEWSDTIKTAVKNYGMTFSIYDDKGRKVSTLINDFLMEGQEKLFFRPKDLNGETWTIRHDVSTGERLDTIPDVEFTATPEGIKHIELSYFEDKNFGRVVRVVSNKDELITSYCPNSHLIAVSKCEDTTLLLGCELGVTDIIIPYNSNVSVISGQMDITKQVDGTADTISDIVFIGADWSYEIYDPEYNIPVTSGYSFAMDAGSGRWKKNLNGIGDNVVNDINPTHYLVSVKTRDSDKKLEFYWRPSDTDGELGQLVGKDFCDKQAFQSRPSLINDFSQYLVKRKSIDKLEYSSHFSILYDRNHDSKINVFDYIMMKRQVIDK